MAAVFHVYRLCTSVILIFLSFSATAQGKICYSQETKKTQMGYIGYDDNIEINDAHSLALQAASLTYKLADLTTAKDGADLVERHAVFNGSIPANYEAANTYIANRNTGVKLVVLKPKIAGWPYIMAITGTENALDWMIDLNLGRQQLENLLELHYMFTYCSYTAEDGEPLSSKNWMIVGHSLGGGLAQAFAYSVQKKRLQMGLDPAAIELVTFNAFGASEVVEKTLEATEPIADTMDIFNYYLTDDVVSKIGRHIGATYEVDANQLPSGIANRHALQSFWTAFSQTGQVRFDLARPRTPPYSKAINALKGVGAYLKFLAENNSDRVPVRLHELNVLEQATNIVLKRGVNQSFDRELVRYLIGMTFHFHKGLSDEPSSPLKEEMKSRIERVQQRLTQASTRR